MDDVIDVIKDEATEDIYRLAGVAGDERAFTPAGESLRKRLPWLGVNLVTAFLAASVVALFEGTIERITALAVFMPIVAGMGGNAGHADADGHRPRHRARRADLEQLAQGAAQGSAGRHRQRRRARRWSRRWWSGPRAAARCWAWCSCAAMIINMFVAATAGTLVPLGLRAANIDPALASSVFITTMTDVFGFFSFLGPGDACFAPAVPPARPSG